MVQFDSYKNSEKLIFRSEIIQNSHILTTIRSIEAEYNGEKTEKLRAKIGDVLGVYLDGKKVGELTDDDSKIQQKIKSLLVP